MQPVGLRIHGLRRAFGPRAILHDLSLELAAGQYVAIVGESGAGKSTLLNLIAGLDRPDGGRIEIGGDDIGALDEAGRTRLRRQRVGFVFQAFHILPHLTVAQNVELPLVLLGVATDERRARAQALLAEVGLGDRGSSAPRELSGGELQRVAVARAIVHRPALLLADEPTGNLDTQTSRDVMDVFTRLNREQGITVLLVTHEPDIAQYAQRLIKFRDGHVIYDGAPDAAH
jgi:putative ABC transport system ATP-binding protein